MVMILIFILHTPLSAVPSALALRPPGGAVSQSGPLIRHHLDERQEPNVTDASLSVRFEENRPRLRAVAYRLLGSTTETEDAVQETWLRIARADAGAVDNLAGWLTTAITHVCLDMLRARKTREDAAPALRTEGAAASESTDPEREVLLADAVGSAMMVVLGTLSPGERVAFVLHDLFALSFEDIGAIVGRSAIATRQLASRARRRVQGAGEVDTELPSQHDVAQAFMAASREGNLEAVLAVLDPDVVLRVDPVTVRAAAANEARGAPRLVSETRGAADVARVFLGGARATRPALVDGTPGAAWAPGGHPRALWTFKVEQGRIAEVQVIGDPKTIARLEVLLLE
jgi:RNA polymerase sigma factor (sigma-70 family)